jgi:SAM-dependent methyltransferase
MTERPRASASRPRRSVDQRHGDPRLAALYDAFDGPRHDLDTYVAMAGDWGARDVLDVGCGTGTFALLLAARGLHVVGLDPASALLDIARAKPGAASVDWICGDARSVRDIEVDLVTMTANVAQAIVDDADWAATLDMARRVLRRGGHLAFETRHPAARAWLTWNREATTRTERVDGDEAVEFSLETLEIRWPLITIGERWRFASDATTLTSTSTLRFRDETEASNDLRTHGFEVMEVRDAPDRPGGELVFIARPTG